MSDLESMNFKSKHPLRISEMKSNAIQYEIKTNSQYKVQYSVGTRIMIISTD